MKLVQSAAALGSAMAKYRHSGKRIGFVPTMGNLHEGHLQLVRLAQQHADVVVVSIFVNPLQFDPHEDFASYPRTLEADSKKLEVLKVDVLYAPEEAGFYPNDKSEIKTIEVPDISDTLCGAQRPGHFRGVTTVVNRLFEQVHPDIAVFGKKDYQQVQIIRLMVQQQQLPIEIMAAETVREADGLAMSSRNQYLDKQQRSIAPGLYQTLKAMAGEIKKTGSVAKDQEQGAIEQLRRDGFIPEYVSIRRAQDLAVASAADSELVILAAAQLGKARLIDNIEVIFDSVNR